MVKDIVSAEPGGGGIDWDALERKLLVVEPLELETGIKTRFTKPGEAGSDAIRANVYVLTGPDTYDAFEDTLIFPRVMIGQLRKKIGKVVVGRLGKGEAKTGQSAPWTLNEATEKDLAKAKTFYANLAVSSASNSSPADEPDDDGFADDDGEDAY